MALGLVTWTGAPSRGWSESPSSSDQEPGIHHHHHPTPLQRQAFELLGISHRLDYA